MKWLLPILTLTFAAGLVAPPALFAQSNLRCDTKQTFCVVDNKRLTIGDEVVVINDDEEIVAHGKISGMRGEARRIHITQKNGIILGGSEVRTGKGGEIAELTTQYRKYQKPAQARGGVALGITNLNVAGETTAYGAEVYYQERFLYGSMWSLRGHLFSASGSAREAEYGETEDFSITATILYGGLAYDFFAKQPFMLRTEANLGVSFIGVSADASSSVTFAAEKTTPEVDKIGAGLGLAGRVGSDIVYRGFGAIMPTAGASFEKINEAQGVTLSAGIVTDI